MTKFWRILFLWLALLHGFQFSAGQVAGASATVEVLEVYSTFPDGIIAYGEAQSDLPLVSATFYLTMDGNTFFNQPATITLEEGRTLLSGAWDGRISSGEHAPPFTELQFWWQLVDSAGNSFNTPPAFSLYTDQRRPWQQTRTDHLDIYSYQQDTALIEFAVQQADSAMQSLENTYGYTLPVRPVMVFYNSAEDAAVDLGADAWEPFGDRVVGRAYPQTNAVILLGVPNLQQLERVIPHELAHLYQFHTGGMFFNAWHWWIEGDAAAQEPLWSQQAMLEQVQAYAQTQQLPHLPTWDFQPQTAADIELITAIGASFVLFLRAQYGDAYHAGFYLNWHETRDFYQAFRLTYGQSLAQLDQQWRAWIAGLLVIVREP